MMRKIYSTILLAVFAAMSAISAGEPLPRDTVKIIENATSVTVIKDGSSVAVKVKGINGSSVDSYEYRSSSNISDTFMDDWDISLPFLRKTRKAKENKWTNSCMFFNGLYVGLIRPIDAPDGMLTSWECGVPFLLGYSAEYAHYVPKFSIGAGMAFRWYNVGRGYGLDRRDDELLIIPVKEGQVSPSSRFTTTSITVSGGLSQYLSESFKLSLVATLDFNVHTSGFYKYYTGSKEGPSRKMDISHLHQKVMRWDFMASLGFDSVFSVYVRYSPAEVFASGYGPRFRQIATGLQFFF